MVHPEVKNWIKYANFEDKHGYIALGRKVFERAVEFFGEDHISESLYVAFARFEEKQKEVWHPVFVSSNKLDVSFSCVTIRFVSFSLREFASSINTLWTESPSNRPRSCLRTTPCLRRGLETGEESKTWSSAKEGFSMKRKSRWVKHDYIYYYYIITWGRIHKEF